MKSELLGPFPESREWLLKYLKTARFKNEKLQGSLSADWSDFSREKSAYLLGVLYGRLRQMDQSLETARGYAEIVKAELDVARSRPSDTST